MKKNKYNEYVKKWKDWERKCKEYYDKRAHLIKIGATDAEMSDLDREYSWDNGEGYTGPWTEIFSQEDLWDPNFVLPGMWVPFKDLTNTDLQIPDYFGKWITGDLKVTGQVIGYGYDATDDYIIVKTEDGAVKYILVNSHYKVYESREDLLSNSTSNVSGSCG